MWRNAELQPCYILHRRDYSDSSLLLEVFSLEYGRLGLIAKGARRSRSANKGLLQPFIPLLLSWKGRGELPTVTAVERHGHSDLPSGKVLMCGMYINELLVRLTQRHAPLTELFPVYVNTLVELQSGADMGAVLRRFECRLLDILGYALVLEFDAASGEPLKAEADYVYYPESGPVLWQNQPDAPVVVPGACLLAMAADDLHDPQLARHAKRLMRTIMAHYLGDRPLVSRDLFR